MTELRVNGAIHEVNADPTTPLLWVLREDLGYTGVKFGCGIGVCGACTVHINGLAVRSCSVPVQTAVGANIVTIEGLPRDAGLPPGKLHPVQEAWISLQVPQCGYCQSGMIMAATSLLKRNASPTDAEIDAAITNLCRCGTYPRIRRALRLLSRQT
jgi:isoquinoline 1-oxidoreductase subunit alpha